MCCTWRTPHWVTLDAQISQQASLPLACQASSNSFSFSWFLLISPSPRLAFLVSQLCEGSQRGTTLLNVDGANVHSLSHSSHVYNFEATWYESALVICSYQAIGLLCVFVCVCVQELGQATNAIKLARLAGSLSLNVDWNCLLSEEEAMERSQRKLSISRVVACRAISQLNWSRSMTR